MNLNNLYRENALHYAVRAGNVEAVKHIVSLRPELRLALNREKEQPHHLCGLRFEEVRPLVVVEKGSQSAPKRITSGDWIKSAISKSSSDMGESIRRLDLKELPLPEWGLQEKLAYLRINIIGRNEVISTPNFWQIINPARTAITSRLLCYHDYTASGRGLAFLEAYCQNMLRMYANTHTEISATGKACNQIYEQAAELIRDHVNAGEASFVIPCGSGLFVFVCCVCLFCLFCFVLFCLFCLFCFVLFCFFVCFVCFVWFGLVCLVCLFVFSPFFSQVRVEQSRSCKKCSVCTWHLPRFKT